MKIKNYLFASMLLLSGWAVTGVAAPEEDPAVLRFEIVSYTLENSTLLSAEEVRKATSPYVGKGKDFSDVQRALEAVEALYAKRGYTAVQVLLPEQELEGGKVRFQAVESRFGQVAVKGMQHFSGENTRHALPSVRTGGVPSSRQIARELKLANENPARQLNVVLKAGKKETEVDAEIQVQDKKPGAWGVTLDNTGNKETGESRLGLSYRHANLLDADQVGSVQLQVSPQHMNRVRVFGGSYKIPLYGMGDSMEFFGGYSNVNSVVGGLTNFQGGGVLLNMRYNQSLARVGSFDPKIIYGLDWRDFKRIEQTRPSNAVLYNEIVVTPLSLGLAVQGKVGQGESNADISMVANMPAASKGKQADFKRYDPLDMLKPDSRYRIVRFNASHTHVVGNDWQVRVALSGQWTKNMLILGEQFRLGGVNGVRGFSEGAEAGESGARGSMELYTPGGNYWDTDVRGLVFFDGGTVRSKSGLKSSIGSTGVGLRATWHEVAFRLDGGHIFNAGSDPLQKKGDWRVHAMLVATF